MRYFYRSDLPESGGALHCGQRRVYCWPLGPEPRLSQHDVRSACTGPQKPERKAHVVYSPSQGGTPKPNAPLPPRGGRGAKQGQQGGQRGAQGDGSSGRCISRGPERGDTAGRAAQMACAAVRPFGRGARKTQRGRGWIPRGQAWGACVSPRNHTSYPGCWG